MEDTKQLYAFTTKLPSKKEEEFNFVIAESFEAAQDKLADSKFAKRPDAKSITYRLQGWITKPEIKEMFAISDMDPITTGAALRYAAEEYKDSLSDLQKTTLVRAARRIEAIIFNPAGDEAVLK